MGLTKEDEAKPIVKRFQWRAQYPRILALTAVLLITAVIFSFRDRLGDVETYKGYGYLGAFLISLVSNATVILPAPGALVVFGLGSLFNPVLIGLTAGLGAALGEFSGYMVGYSGQPVVENRRFYLRIQGWMQRRGSLTIFAFSLIPFLPFDIAGFVAGAVRFPPWKFFLLCWAGRAPVYIAACYAGGWLVDLIQRLGG